jgi:hypothetical protein
MRPVASCGSLSRSHERRGRSDAGFAIYWPDVDEDLSTEGLLREPLPRRSRPAPM